jgi:hypothetical protein
VQSTTTRIPLSTSLFRYPWIVQLWYSGPATTMRFELGTAVRDVVLPAGQRSAYVPVTGKGSAVLVRSLSQGPPACISRLTVGLMYAARPTAIRPAALARQHRSRGSDLSDPTEPVP